jgi:hypothetical protein
MVKTAVSELDSQGSTLDRDARTFPFTITTGITK